MCWPETRVNQTVFLPCPDYLNKFNKLGNDFNGNDLVKIQI